MKKNNLFWLKIHRMSDEGDGSNTDDSGGEGSLLPAAGGAAGDGTDNADGDQSGDGAGDDDEQSWFKKDKYKTVEDQAKAYVELEKKLGERNELVGAPEDGVYNLTMPEDLAEAGEVAADDPMLKAFMETAKELNLSQKAFDSILHGYIKSEFESMGTSREDEIKQLGDNADRRLDALAKWGEANLDADTYEAFRNVASTAAGVTVLEAMRAAGREHALSSANENQQPTGSGMTPEKLKEMAGKKDEHGNRLMSVDPAYKKKVDQAYTDYYGAEPKTTVVGG